MSSVNQLQNQIESAYTMPKGNNSIESIKDNRRVDHFVIVQFTKILHLCESPLVELEIVLLQTDSDPLEYIINSTDHEILMIPVKRARENREKVDTTVLNFLWFAENLLENLDDLYSCKQKCTDVPSDRYKNSTSGSSQ